MNNYTCTCPRIKVGSTTTGNRSLSELCAEHGIGTKYWRALDQRPYGFRDDEFAVMTRVEYLELLAELQRADEAIAYDDDVDENGDQRNCAPVGPLECEVIPAEKWMLLPLMKGDDT